MPKLKRTVPKVRLSARCLQLKLTDSSDEHREINGWTDRGNAGLVFDFTENNNKISSCCVDKNKYCLAVAGAYQDAVSSLNVNTLSPTILRTAT